MIQPYQEEITELVDTVEKKANEFTSSKGVIETIEDPLITDVMLSAAQECVAGMDQDISKLKEKFQKTLQEAKEKLQKKKSMPGGSRMSHKC